MREFCNLLLKLYNKLCEIKINFEIISPFRADAIDIIVAFHNPLYLF